MKDLIDDNPIEEESDGDSDASQGSKKRKKSDDEDFDDRLDDEDYDVLEENLGVKLERVSFFFFRLNSDMLNFFFQTKLLSSEKIQALEKD